MSKLRISKLTEAKTVATIWNMGIESLDPESYAKLEDVLKLLCMTRRINNEVIAVEQRVLSGKECHNSDCHTSDAPALIPGPCDCDCSESDQPDKQLSIYKGNFNAICEILNIDPNSSFDDIFEAIESSNN